MKPEIVERALSRLADLIANGRFEELESDTLEIKPVPSDGQSWRERHKTACAFLNTRGGIIILGIKEVGQGASRRYEFTGWQPNSEGKVKEISRQFKDADGHLLDIPDAFPPPMVIDFLGGQVAAVLVDELPADTKYAFYEEQAYKRILTGDHKISRPELERQQEFKEEAVHARELQPVKGMTLEDLDLDKLNEYIAELNRLGRVETLKADLNAAVPFLKRKCFLKNEVVTTLGALVCAKNPGDMLDFRAHVHGIVDAPQEIARDKQDLVDNILPLMERSFAYVLRNIQVGISYERGGANRSEYPEELLRETINNALAHRDYSINRQVIIEIKPRQLISIRNPGKFRSHLLIQRSNHSVSVLRIVPETKPRNPKLADVLRVYRKWEGRGIGMSTLVNLCLQNRIDLPYYRLATEEVTLHLIAGRLLDDRMKRLFDSFDRYISEKLSGSPPTEPQLLVLAYLIKSEWENDRSRHTVLLTPDNNHFNELLTLEKAGLISKLSDEEGLYAIYVADRQLLRKDYVPELRSKFGSLFDALNPLQKEILSVVYRSNCFSTVAAVSAKQASFTLWRHHGSDNEIREFDAFYRSVRNAFKALADIKILEKKEPGRGYVLRDSSGQDLFDRTP